MSRELTEELYRSLDERHRPEDVAEKVAALLGADLDPATRKALAHVIGARRHRWSGMSTDFARPVGMGRQLAVAEALFATGEQPEDLNVVGISEYLERTCAAIGKRIGASDFKRDRLNREARRKSGMETPRRQYNKRFRLLARMEAKVETLAAELEKREFTLVSKSRLAARLTWDDFSRDCGTACFIAYYVARCNLRSQFTNTRQQKPYDPLCDALFQRCRRSGTANWWAIAHTLPDAEALAHLTDEQRGALLGMWYDVLFRIAVLLQRTWERSNIDRETMIVRRGNDSSTWNVTAGAWNRAREGWVAVVHGMGVEEILERQCPGKVLRLMAADVAWWHRRSGGDLEPDTRVWSALPLPWEVVRGEAECPRSLVEEACARCGVDPVKNGWAAPRPGRAVQPFRPTPELVHGVTVASPELGVLLRKAGWFSARKARPVDVDVVIHRDPHGAALAAEEAAREGA